MYVLSGLLGPSVLAMVGAGKNKFSGWGYSAKVWNVSGVLWRETAAVLWQI